MKQLILTLTAARPLCLAATLSCSAAFAVANSGSDVPPLPLERTVRFQDLDLSKTGDVSALYGRLLHAARALCEPFHRSGLTISAKQSAQAAACIDQSVDAAVKHIHSPLLTQYRQSIATGEARRVRLAHK
jgi:UrcA family protein